MDKAAIFVSDLHLGTGDELDDFILKNEAEFTRFLSQQSSDFASWEVDLVLLGDLLDIWQAAPPEEKKAPDTKNINLSILQSLESQRVQQIIAAHPETFRALKAFLAADADRRHLVMVTGNHDHSLIDARVQDLVRQALTGGDPALAARVVFSQYYDAPHLSAYAEHGNQLDDNNAYEHFLQFGEECPGFYFVRLFWNRLESLEPKLDEWDWWNAFKAIWEDKLFYLIPPAMRFFRQYRRDPRDFKRIDVPGVPFFAVPGQMPAAQRLAEFPDVLVSDEPFPGLIFSTDPATENRLRSLYHVNPEFKAEVDKILQEKFPGQAPPVPQPEAVPLAFAPFHDEYVDKVAGMFASPGEKPEVMPRKGEALDPATYKFVLLGHTHADGEAQIPDTDATYFNTGTWSVKRNAAGANISKLCYVTVRRPSGQIPAAARRYYHEGKTMSPETTSGRDLVYCNGIDPDTGTYALPPFNVDDLARNIRSRQGSPRIMKLQREAAIRTFAAPFGVDLAKPEEAGWAIVFHEDTPQDVREALAPLIAHRRQQAGDRFKQMDYTKGEQVRNWYQRYGVSPGNLDPAIVPYYLLLVGPPTGIPFDFQYLLGVEYAVGRLDFNQASDYAGYAQSVVDYEQGPVVNNAREIVYWGTRHPNDPATNLSTSMLISPLANGLENSPGSLKKPIHQEVGYRRQLYSDAAATKAQLLSVFSAPMPPALLFTASHGMALKAGKAEQPSVQGGLLCQDWPGYGQVTQDHYLAAADVPDNARVGGLVAFMFACFSAGTPDNDQFLMNLGEDAAAAKLSPQPFVAALPRRLLSHPLGSALAVIGHVDRAWGFSIQPLKATTAQIEVFRNTLGYILTGSPVGHALTIDFGLRFAALSAGLLSAVSPSATPGSQLSDRDLVLNWLERNDAQNYVLLGDPLARLRAEALS